MAASRPPRAEAWEDWQQQEPLCKCRGENRNRWRRQTLRLRRQPTLSSDGRALSSAHAHHLQQARLCWTLELSILGAKHPSMKPSSLHSKLRLCRNQSHRLCPLNAGLHVCVIICNLLTHFLKNQWSSYLFASGSFHIENGIFMQKYFVYLDICIFS